MWQAFQNFTVTPECRREHPEHRQPETSPHPGTERHAPGRQSRTSNMSSMNSCKLQAAGFLPKTSETRRENNQMAPVAVCSKFQPTQTGRKVAGDETSIFKAEWMGLQLSERESTRWKRRWREAARFCFQNKIDQN